MGLIWDYAGTKFGLVACSTCVGSHFVDLSGKVEIELIVWFGLGQWHKRRKWISGISKRSERQMKSEHEETLPIFADGQRKN